MNMTQAFSPKELAVAEIQQRIARKQLTKVASLAGDELAIYRIRLGKNAPVSGKPLSQLTLMPDCMVIAIEKDEHHGAVPSAQEILEERDVVFVVIRKDFEKELKHLFAVD